MARIAGVNIPDNKRVEVALTYIYGIGRTTANKILDTTKIDKNQRVKDLKDSELNELRSVIEKSYKVEGSLRQEVVFNIKQLKEIGSYRGMRHAKNLPSRGQRTRTNSRTVRGNVRRTAGSGRKAAAEKT